MSWTQFQRMGMGHSKHLNMDRVKFQILKRYRCKQLAKSYFHEKNGSMLLTDLPNGIPNFCSNQLLCNCCHYWFHDFFSNNDPNLKKIIINVLYTYYLINKIKTISFVETTYMISWIFVTIRISHRQNMEIQMVQKIFTIAIDQPVNQKGGSC